MQFKIETVKTAQEVIEIIAKNTSEKQALLDTTVPDEYFSGKVTENSFKLRRNLEKKTSFLPVIIGMVKENEPGATVHIKMRLPLYQIIFLALWFIGLFVGCLLAFTDITLSNIIMPLAFAAFGALVVIAPYRKEANTVREKIEALLN